MGGEEDKPTEETTEKEEVQVPKVQVAFLNAPWWTLVLQGLFVLVLGIMAMVYPDITLEIFLMLFGALILIQGIFAIIGSFAIKAEDPMWVLLLIGGIISVILGSIALFWPDVTAVILLWLIGFWALIVGTVMLIYALKVRKAEVAGKGIQAVMGIVGIVFGLVALAWPEQTAMTIVWFIGLFAVLFGILFIIVGFKAKSKQG